MQKVHHNDYLKLKAGLFSMKRFIFAINPKLKKPPLKTES